MDLLSKEECVSILEALYPNEPINFIGYRFENFENHVEGYLSTSKKLVVEYSKKCDKNKNEISFFAKILPQGNDFHVEYILSNRCFDKEVFFFNKIKPNLDLWSSREVLPKCYLAVPDKIVVLEYFEDWRVKDISEYFRKDEIKSAIKALAVFHSASMMFESKNGIDLKFLWGDYFFSTLYSRVDGHMGFRHILTGTRALKALIESIHPNLENAIKVKIGDIFENLPELVLPSTKFRNVVSHGDLYTNNIMLPINCTSESPTKIIDFQLFSFNPPALDLLLAIYTTTDITGHNISGLCEYYYTCVESCMREFGFDVTVELPNGEFQESLNYYRSMAITITLLFQHYVNLPSDVIKMIHDDTSLLKKFMIEDRNEIVLSSFENNLSYRNKLSSTISLLVKSCDVNVK